MGIHTFRVGFGVSVTRDYNQETLGIAHTIDANGITHIARMRGCDLVHTPGCRSWLSNELSAVTTTRLRRLSTQGRRNHHANNSDRRKIGVCEGWCLSKIVLVVLSSCGNAGGAPLLLRLRAALLCSFVCGRQEPASFAPSFAGGRSLGRPFGTTMVLSQMNGVIAVVGRYWHTTELSG